MRALLLILSALCLTVTTGCGSSDDGGGGPVVNALETGSGDALTMGDVVDRQFCMTEDDCAATDDGQWDEFFETRQALSEDATTLANIDTVVHTSNDTLDLYDGDSLILTLAPRATENGEAGNTDETGPVLMFGDGFEAGELEVVEMNADLDITSVDLGFDAQSADTGTANLSFNIQSCDTEGANCEPFRVILFIEQQQDDGSQNPQDQGQEQEQQQEQDDGKDQEEQDDGKQDEQEQAQDDGKQDEQEQDDDKQDEQEQEQDEDKQDEQEQDQEEEQDDKK